MFASYTTGKDCPPWVHSSALSNTLCAKPIGFTARVLAGTAA